MVKDEEWSERRFPWCRYIREVSFVRHTELNSVVYCLAAVGKRLIVLNSPWLSRDCQLRTYLYLRLQNVRILLGLSIASCDSHTSAIRIQ